MIDPCDGARSVLYPSSASTAAGGGADLFKPAVILLK